MPFNSRTLNIDNSVVLLDVCFDNLLLGLSLLSITTLAFAQTTVADIANNFIPQLTNGVGPLLEAFSYVFGIGLSIKGILKLKEYNGYKQRH